MDVDSLLSFSGDYDENSSISWNITEDSLLSYQESSQYETVFLNEEGSLSRSWILDDGTSQDGTSAMMKHDYSEKDEWDNGEDLLYSQNFILSFEKESSLTCLEHENLSACASFHQSNEIHKSRKIRLNQDQYRHLVSNPLDPIAKFVRDSRISLIEMNVLGLLGILQSAPTIKRLKLVPLKYGHRKSLQAHERKRIEQDRNKLHARATRLRKKVFDKATCILLNYRTSEAYGFYTPQNLVDTFLAQNHKYKDGYSISLEAVFENSFSTLLPLILNPDIGFDFIQKSSSTKRNEVLDLLRNLEDMIKVFVFNFPPDSSHFYDKIEVNKIKSFTLGLKHYLMDHISAHTTTKDAWHLVMKQTDSNLRCSVDPLSLDMDLEIFLYDELRQIRYQKLLKGAVRFIVARHEHNSLYCYKLELRLDLGDLFS